MQLLNVEFVKTKKNKLVTFQKITIPPQRTPTTNFSVCLNFLESTERPSAWKLLDQIRSGSDQKHSCPNTSTALQQKVCEQIGQQRECEQRMWLWKKNKFLCITTLFTKSVVQTKMTEKVSYIARFILSTNSLISLLEKRFNEQADSDLFTKRPTAL